MYRRTFLAAVGTTGVLSGCLSGPEETRPATDTEEAASVTPDPASGEPAPTASTTTAAANSTANEGGETGDTTNLGSFGVPATVCAENLRPDPGIYAILEPAFAEDWSSHDVDSTYRYDAQSEGLAADQTVIGLSAGERPRAYPLTVLNIHEVVNDRLGGPIIVTFCPLCRSGMVADRLIGGDVTRFAVSGLLWKPERIQSVASEQRNRTFGASATGGEEISVRHSGNLVMYDAATRSYWSQILARGICGPEAGTELDIAPSTVAEWGEWRDRHPRTEVLLPPPHSETVTPGTILGAD